MRNSSTTKGCVVMVVSCKIALKGLLRICTEKKQNCYNCVVERSRHNGYLSM